MENKLCIEKGCFRTKYNSSEYCKTHYVKYNMRKWRAKNPDKRNDYYRKNKKKVKAQRDKIRDRINALQTKNRKALRKEVLYKYSDGKINCNRCGFDDERALVIDHIKNNGAEERKRLIKGDKKRTLGSYAFYYYLRKNNFPKGYQVLCANCNLIKEKERYA